MDRKEELKKEIEKIETEHLIGTGFPPEDCGEEDCIDRENMRICRAELKGIEETERAIANRLKSRYEYYKNGEITHTWIALVISELTMLEEEIRGEI